MTASRANPNPDWTPASADELAVCEHPRVRAMKLPVKGASPAKLVLEPAEPSLGPSRFLRGHAPSDGGQWRRWPDGPQGNGIGRGCGFRKLTQRPSAFHNAPKPARSPQLWEQTGYLLVSPEVRDIFCRYDASAIEFCEIDWHYRDGSRLEGYGLLDVINLLPAYDYARSKIAVSRYPDGATWILPVPPTALRADIAPEIHCFREERWRRLYCSRELAAELAPFAGNDLVFTDPMTGDTVTHFGERKEKTVRPPAAPPAIVHELPSAPQFSGASLWRWISSFREDCDLATAETKAVEAMRALPESPLHAAIAPGVAITTPPAEVADYLNAFWKQAVKQGKPQVLYAEMNAFTINPDEWFFDLFAFSQEGNESFDWLGNFYASTDRGCVIKGMERLQAVFAQREMEPRLFAGHDDAKMLAEMLVIIRFQRLLQQALAHSKLEVRLLASAHDRPEGLVVIKPPTA